MCAFALPNRPAAACLADWDNLLQNESLTYEWSVRVAPTSCQERDKRIVWLNKPEEVGTWPSDAIIQLLQHVHCPADLIEEISNLKHPPQALGLGINTRGEGGGIVYIHRNHPNPAERYKAHFWNPQATAQPNAPNQPPAVYQSWFFPETPTGVKPIDSVASEHKSLFKKLIGIERVQQLSTFWLRTQNNQTNQACITFSWMPALSELLPLLATELAHPVSEKLGQWANQRVRHIAFSCGPKSPTQPAEFIIYFSGHINSLALTNPVAACEQATQSSTEAAHAINHLVFDQLQAPCKPTNPPNLEAFYTPQNLANWKKVLGPALHYHHGEFELNHRIDTWSDQPFERTIEQVARFISPGESVYDLGCGWGSTSRYLIDHKHCRVLAQTISKAQYQHCFKQGIDVRWGNMEHTLPPSYFDTILFLESFEHVYDKATLLKNLRHFCGKIVMRISCQNWTEEPLRFGNTMHMISSDQLRELIEQSGWRIRHWRNLRPLVLPTQKVWHERLKHIPQTQDLHLEVLRTHCQQACEALEGWAESNPFIEVVLD